MRGRRNLLPQKAPLLAAPVRKARPPRLTPGAHEAKRRGCTCPMPENFFGAGDGNPDHPTYVVTPGCPLHAGAPANAFERVPIDRTTITLTAKREDLGGRLVAGGYLSPAGRLYRPKPCSRCGETFQPTGPRSVYCGSNRCLEPEVTS